MILTCPLEYGTGSEQKEAYSWDSPEQKLVMMSKVDSNVRSCISATVVKAEPSEDNSYDIVINVKEFYFWYHGQMKPVVKVGQKVKAGQTLAIYIQGTELEFRMFKEEEMKDPREFLDCKAVKME